MASEELKRERTKLNESAIHEHQLAVKQGTTTNLIQCRKYELNFLLYFSSIVNETILLDVNKITVHILKLRHVVLMNR